MSDKIKLLVNSRKYTRKLVTERHNSKDDIDGLSQILKNQVKAQLQDYSDTLKDLNAKIQGAKWEESEDESWLNSELKVCEDYFSKIRECLVLTEYKAPSGSDVENARSLLKSPTAPLPTFKSEENEDLTKFFTDFEAITSLFKYSNYDKFVLLKQQVSGRALVLLNSLESDKKGYDHAKDLLVSALASKDTRTFNIIKQLTELKLEVGNDPFGYVSQMRNITEAVGKLQLDTDSFLRYFFWIGLNNKFQSILTQITNSSKPTLNQINDNFFEASDRYMIEQRNSKNVKTEKKVSTITAAADVSHDIKPKKSFKACSICTKLEGKEADHPIFRCCKFLSPKEKIEKLKEIKGCLKCADLSHLTHGCKFKFRKKCIHCNNWHFSFLCLKQDKNSNNDQSRPPMQETVSTLAITEALETTASNDTSMLPTFSCTLENGLKFRALKDGGCQSNFVSMKLADSCNFKVLKDNVSLYLKGINMTKDYCTKLVEIPFCIGDKKYVLEAFVIPRIDIHLVLPGLGHLVHKLVDKGFMMCDDYLLEYTDRIDNLDFILGSKSGYCLPESEKVFGRKGKSLISRTAHGLLLKGNIHDFLTDLDYLPDCPDVINTLVAETLSSKSDKQNKLTAHNLGFSLDSFSLYSSVDNYEVPLSDNLNVVDDEGNLIKSELDKATLEVLKYSCDHYTNLDTEKYDLDSFDLNKELVNYALDNTTRNHEGRLVMPLLWNAKVSHLLGKNERLSKLILQSNFRKLKNNNVQFNLMDETIKNQENEGIIERIDNLDQFLRYHPSHSFLPHMGIFKMDRMTTKCRVVYLSNLKENDGSKSLTVSHNQAIHSGPCLNQKLGSAILHLRFDENLLCFDLCKAFNQIALNDVDANRLLFLWFRNVSKKDYSLVGYRNVRLSFGLRCSPTILLLGLYNILILDVKNDSTKLKNLKKLIYSLCYMDNCGLSTNDTSDLRWAYSQLKSIFEPYKFALQQFVTNDESLQKEMDATYDVETPQKVKLLGLQWDRCEDKLSTKKVVRYES